MNLGFFGGTFDPIHLGHLSLAQAARESFNLGRVYFVPTGVPPHKQEQQIASYFDRYAMVVLATTNEKEFIPSLLEAPGAVPAPLGGEGPKSGHGMPGANYTIETVRRFKQNMKKADRLFLLVGIDAFRDVSSWHEADALFRECEFIVASRPGFSLADVAAALPETIRPSDAVTKPFEKQPAKGDIVLPGATVHLLESVHQPVSATAIREAVAAKRSLTKWVDPAVAEYIKKKGLYL
jgi:nicotinate-nucleotide adenylyltransferase